MTPARALDLTHEEWRRIRGLQQELASAYAAAAALHHALLAALPHTPERRRARRWHRISAALSSDCRRLAQRADHLIEGGDDGLAISAPDPLTAYDHMTGEVGYWPDALERQDGWHHG